VDGHQIFPGWMRASLSRRRSQNRCSSELASSAIRCPPQLGERQPCRGEPAHDRADRRRQNFGRLAIAQTFDIDEQDSLPLRLGKATNFLNTCAAKIFVSISWLPSNTSASLASTKPPPTTDIGDGAETARVLFAWAKAAAHACDLAAELARRSTKLAEAALVGHATAFGRIERY
jgi:hypothetical protein